MKAFAFIVGMVVGGIVGIVAAAIVFSAKKTRQGIWRYTDKAKDADKWWTECSHCGFTTTEDFSDVFEYCPCCGTNMIRFADPRKDMVEAVEKIKQTIREEKEKEGESDG